MKIAHACDKQRKLRRFLREGRAKLMSVTVSQSPSGNWSVSITYQLTPRKAQQNPGHKNAGQRPIIGVDRGITSSAIVGSRMSVVPVAELPQSRWFRRAQKQLACAQRVMSRRYVRGAKTQSKNYEKARRKVARLHERIGNQRANHLHTFTKLLTDEYPVLVLETLATQNLMKNRYLAKAIAEQGWYRNRSWLLVVIGYLTL